MNPTLKRVVVGLSGGVDSAVAAFLLLKQGFQVEALFMKNWEEDDSDNHCDAANDLKMAEAVCDKLNIRLHRANFSQEYWDQVFEHFLTEHRLGRTPNPDVLCNREIKFKLFLNCALELGADYIATGHYVQSFLQSEYYQLHKAIDLNKDQSYFLYLLEQHALAKSLFPIGRLDKSTVRHIAKEAGLPNHQKKDSTGICFIGKRNFKDFLRQYIAPEPGVIETPDRRVLGQHIGLMFYTIGQRQGLGIGGQRQAANSPWYVVSKDFTRNALIVVQGKNHPALYGQTVHASQLHWIANTVPKDILECSAKIRYRQTEEPCTVMLIPPESCKVIFKRPQWAITPGQSIVFYQHTMCLGGGIIQ